MDKRVENVCSSINRCSQSHRTNVKLLTMKLAPSNKTGKKIYGEDDRLITPSFLLGVVIILIFLWLFDYFILRTPILTPFVKNGQNLKPLTPLYAFWMPVIRPEALAFLVVSLCFVVFSSVAQKTNQITPLMFAIFTCLSFLALSVTLFTVRDAVSNLASNLLIYPREEVYYDAQRILSINDFIRNYKILQPDLSMRGQHYPPGGAIFLYILMQTFGAGLWKIGIAIIVVASTSVTLCYLSMRYILPDRHARQATLLIIASPSLLNYTCTSMDIVFFLFASLSLLLAAMSQRRQIKLASHNDFYYLALFAGIMLYFASFISFSAFSLGMCLVLYLIINGRAYIKQTAIQLVTLVGGFAMTYLIFYLIFDYSLFENLSYARQNNFEFLSSVLNRPVSDYYFYSCYGNIAAFIIGCGIAVIGAFINSSIDHLFRWTPWRIASLISLFIMTVGGMYTMETERIWIFVIPWMAIYALSNRPFRDSSIRLLLSCGLIQAFLMEALLFTLW
jgi:dolichyl-phosphate-mannose-protein mannosyltransferase